MRNKISRSGRLISLPGLTFDRIQQKKIVVGLVHGEVSRNFMKLLTLSLVTGRGP